MYLGLIKPFCGLYIPRGWHICDGTYLSVAHYTDLYSILGTFYGGDGIYSFRLPDLGGKAIVGVGQGPDLKNRTLGETGGSPVASLSLDQMPAHTHYVNASSQPADKASPAEAVWAKEPEETTFLYSDAEGNTQMRSSAISKSGNNKQHENMQPYLALHYIICITGQIPPRT